MAGSENPPQPPERTDDVRGLVKYALRITNTVVWDWDIPADDITIYPSSQGVFDEVKVADDFFSQVHPFDRPNVADALETALEDTGTYNTEFRLADDDSRWIAAHGHVEYDDDEPTRLTGVGQDVSEQRQRQLKLMRFGEHIAETELISEVGGWELETETETLWWTDGTKRIHGVPPEYEPTLDDALSFYHPSDRPVVEQAVEHCREHGEPYSVEVRLITATGDEQWVHCRGERAQRDEVEILRGVIRDITDQKVKDQRLMVLNRVLRHNIRNSLGVVIGNAEILGEDLAALAPLEAHLAEKAGFSLEDAYDSLSRIHRNAKQLAKMADDARRLSQALEHGRVRYYVAVDPLVNRLADEVRESHPEATVRVDEATAGVRANTESLEMVLREVFENAIQHTTDGTPTVEVDTYMPDDERVSIRVADTGPGIPAMEREVLERGLEEPLMHGRGTGLWMVNWLLTQLGGSVAIEDNTPSGSIVTLTLPAATGTHLDR